MSEQPELEATLAQPAMARRGTSGLVALALVGGGVAGGAALTHAVWPARAATSPVAASSGSGLSQAPSFGFGNGPGATTTSDGPSDPASIAAKVNDAIVDINTTVGYANARAAGTGMVLTSTGEVLTNNHVISGATKISVTDVGNGKTYAATVVGYSKSEDIAVLQLKNATGLATITAATSPVAVGAGIVGVGNAGGTGGTPSYAGGVVVQVGQTITASDEGDGTSEQLTGLIETDANVVAGDSGGPLVDEQGRVVGMDTAASSGYAFNRTADAFAIPVATALRVADQIESANASSTVHIGPTAMLGVEVQTANGYSASGTGAAVAGVLNGGPADRAGLSAGDVITSLAGHPVRGPQDLSDIILGKAPGTTVTVQYVDREGAIRSTQLRLATGPPQ
jgi:S1-C subfamily serine protease